MQFGILHITKDATGIVELAVVEIGQGGESLGVAVGGAGHQGAVPGKSQVLAEAGERTHQQGNVPLGIEQFKPGLIEFGFRGIRR